MTNQSEPSGERPRAEWAAGFREISREYRQAMGDRQGDSGNSVRL